MRRALAIAVVLAASAVPAHGAADGGVTVQWYEQPRLVSSLPLMVSAAAPSSFRATVAVTVRGRSLATVVRDGHVGPAAPVLPEIRLTAPQRRTIAAAAAAAHAAPDVTATVAFRHDADGAAEEAGAGTQIRLAPFYDTSLRFPDAVQNRSYSMSFDLPSGEWLQVHGQLSGTVATGTFRRYVGGRAARCPATVSVGARTTLRAPRVPHGALRGRIGKRRWWTVGNEAVAVLPAPASLPGRRPLLVIGAGDGGFTNAACGVSALRAAARRAVQTAIVRRGLPQPGPGFDPA